MVKLGVAFDECCMGEWKGVVGYSENIITPIDQGILK